MESDEKKAMHNDMQHSATEHAEPGANGSLRHPHHGTDGGGDGIGRPSVRDSQMYKKILGQSLKQTGLGSTKRESLRQEGTEPSTASPHIPPPEAAAAGSTLMNIPGLSEQENRNLVHEVVQVAATAATIAARDVGTTPVRATSGTHALSHGGPKHNHPRTSPAVAGGGGVSAPANDDNDDAATVEALAPASGGGHDAPNWSRMKSTVILLGATLLYAIIAEILVNTVDVVLDNADIDEKFLGITLFALVPNTTEFLVRPNVHLFVIHPSSIHPSIPSIHSFVDLSPSGISIQTSLQFPV